MEVFVLYSNSVFHKRWLAKQQKSTITINDYEEDDAGAAGSRQKGPPIEEEEEPLMKVPQKNHGNVGPLIYTGVGILPLPKFTDYPDGEKALCGGVLRDGTRGCNRPTCKLDHSPNISSLNKYDLTYLYPVLQSNPGASTPLKNRPFSRQ